MFCQKSWVIGTYDEGPGKRWRCTEKISVRITMTMKGGRASRPKVAPVETLSSALFGRRAGEEREGNRDAERHDLREDDELDVDGHGVRDRVGDRLVGDEGLAEVALEDVPDVGEVLLQQRLVEAELLQEERLVLGRVVRTEDGDRGITGQQVHQEERADRDQEDHHDQGRQALQDVEAHPPHLLGRSKLAVRSPEAHPMRTRSQVTATRSAVRPGI